MKLKFKATKSEVIVINLLTDIAASLRILAAKSHDGSDVELSDEFTESFNSIRAGVQSDIVFDTEETVGTKEQE